MTSQGREASAITDAEMETSTSSRRRTNGRACITCHRRKVKCDVLDKGIPCSNCQTHQRDDCQIYEKKKLRTRHAKPLPKLRSRGRPVAAAAPATPASTASGQWSDGLISHPTPSNISAQPPPQSLPIAADSIEAVAAPPSDSGTDEREHEPETRNLATFINQDAPKRLEIKGTGRLYFLGTEFSNLNYLVHQRLRGEEGIGLHFGSQVFMQKMPVVPPEILELPPKDLADRLVDAYFVHVNRGFPVVDQVEFMEFYNGKTLGDRSVSLLLLNAIFLVGAHVLSPRREDAQALKATFFHRAKTLFDLRADKHRETCMQAALLLTWQCDSLEDVVSNSWYWIGVAARTAFGMGMHRDATHSRHRPTDKRQWVRLWWITFQFDVLTSAAYGRPQAIHLDEADVPLLEAGHFEGIDQAETTFAMHHTKLCILFSKAMKRRVALQSTPAERIEATKEADRNLAEFTADLPERLQLRLSSPDIWQCTLHLTYNHFLILLHRPPPRPDPSQASSPDLAADISICSDAVTAITAIFESLRDRNDLCKLWLPSLHILFTAMVHLTSEIRSDNPIMAAKTRRMYDSLMLTIREFSRHWLYARSLLRLFGKRAVWGEERVGPRQGEEEGVLRHGGNGFSLRPNSAATDPAGIATGAAGNGSVMGTAGTEPPFTALAMGPFGSVRYPTDNGLGLGMDPQAMGDMHGDGSDGFYFGDGFMDGGAGMDMMGGSALEFLLAGMDNEYLF